MGSKLFDEDPPTYASSIPVPNVQEIARNDPCNVPERYLRSQEDMDINSNMPHLSSEIPVIDLSLLTKGDKEELNKLDISCKDWGFFQVVNHGVASEVLQSMKDATSKFFDLPLEEKNKFAMPSNDVQGYGHAYVVSEEQKLDWSDTLILLVYPSHYRKLEFWPTVPNAFKETIEAYSSGVRNVAKELLSSLSYIMGMDKDGLLGLHKVLVQPLRVNYYPACSSPDQVLGISPHSDTSTITILMQDDSLCGLQIRHQGGWVPVKPIPGAFVVNVGDILEIWSNGKYKSIEHRAVTNGKKARISCASFLTPHDDVHIEPFEHVLDSHRPFKIYKKVKYGEYLRHSLSRKMEGKAHTQMAKIET